MPMDFPDFDSLVRAAEVYSFRKAVDGESEEEYREALADHAQGIDFLESQEIRFKVGYDKFSRSQVVDCIYRRPIGDV